MRLEEGAKVDRSIAQKTAEEGAAQKGEIGGCVALACTAAIFIPGGISAVVVAVLDHPVAADQASKSGRIGLRGRETGQIIMGLDAGVPVTFADAGALDRDRLEGVEEADLVGGAGHNRHFPGFYAPVADVGVGKKGGRLSTRLCRDFFTTGVLPLIWRT